MFISDTCYYFSGIWDNYKQTYNEIVSLLKREEWNGTPCTGGWPAFSQPVVKLLPIFHFSVCNAAEWHSYFFKA